MDKAKPTKWYENRFLIVLIIIALFMAIMGINSLFEQYKNIDVTGTLSLTDTSYGNAGDSCSGSGGYSDITQGAQVTASNNNSNSIIATSELSDGVVDKSGNCVFNFKVKDISYSTVYQFQVSHRGQLVYSRQKLIDNKFDISMTLGN